jgi:hypothetical protein
MTGFRRRTDDAAIRLDSLTDAELSALRALCERGAQTAPGWQREFWARLAEALSDVQARRTLAWCQAMAAVGQIDYPDE